MSKYTVTHTCGHEHEYNLFGKHTERDRKIEWLSGKECPECHRKAEEESAKEATAGIELPELEGSEKQVKWAKTIRAQFINRILSESEEIKGKKQFRYGRFEYISEDEALNLIVTRKEARTFIDWRNEGVEALIDNILFKKQIEAAKATQKPTESR